MGRCTTQNTDATAHFVNNDVETGLVLVALDERGAAGSQQQLVLSEHALQLLDQQPRLFGSDGA